MMSRDTNGISLAVNPNTPASVLKKLAEEEGEDVRRAVATNPNSPVATLKKLARDEDEGVRLSAVESLYILSTPSRTYDQAAC